MIVKVVKLDQMKNLQNPYLFQSVLSELSVKFLPAVEDEIATCFGKADQSYQKAQQFFQEHRMEVFPRSNPRYCEIVSTLSSIASYDYVGVVALLKQVMGEVLLRRRSKTFQEIQSHNANTFETYLIRFFLLTLVTDTICDIVRKLDTATQTDKTAVNAIAKTLISTGISICMSEQENNLSVFLLNQWSVIMSVVSKLAPKMLYHGLTQFIVNKSDLFFVLMRYVRLDAEGAESEHLMEIMKSHVRKAKLRRVLTSSMLISLSTFLMTYKGQSAALTEFFNTALPLCNKPEACPGAVELVTTLLPKMDGWSTEQIHNFYIEKVFPLAKVEGGMVTAVRVFRNMMFGAEIDPDYVFSTWSPSQHNFFEFLKHKRKDTSVEFGPLFMKYYFDSPYSRECPTLLRDVLVHLAALDFSYFTNEMWAKFKGLLTKPGDEESNRFMVFLNTIPMINNEEFCKHSGVEAEKVRAFNSEVGDFIGMTLRDAMNKLTDYGFTPDQTNPRQHKMNEAWSKVMNQSKHWGVDAGTPYEIQVVGINKDQVHNIGHSARIIKIIPYVIDSPMFATSEWMERIIKLAAYGAESVSRPAYQICQRVMHLPDRRDLLVEECVKLIESRQIPEIVFVCLELLSEAIDEFEPETPKSETSIEYKVEYAAFLSLAYANPLVRLSGYDLLVKMNKVLQNQGLFSNFEEHIPAITSNVKHNILLQAFAKRPGHTEHRDGEISLSLAKASRCQNPWLFFLAEIGRIIVYSNYKTILTKIVELANNYHVGPELNDSDLGILVIFFATCTIQKNVDIAMYGDDIPESFLSEDTCFSDRLNEIIKELINGSKTSRDLLFQAMKHSNYTFVPSLIRLLAQMKQSKEILKCLPSLVLVLQSIDGNANLRQKVFPDLLRLLTDTMKVAFIDSRLNVLAFTPNIVCDLTTEKTPAHVKMVLSYLTCLVFWLETDNCTEDMKKWSVLSRGNTLILIANWACISEDIEHCTIVRTYAAAALVPMLECGPINRLAPGISLQFVRGLSECERLGYHVLCPLLENNTTEFLPLYIDSCFRRKALMTDAFFDAICSVVTTVSAKAKNRRVRGELNLWTKYAGSLFLVGIFRTKTGSQGAENFLKIFIPFYASMIGNQTDPNLTTDMMTLPIEDVPAKHFIRVAESLVKEALDQLINDRYKGTIKVMVDILIPWIRQFRMLPSQGVCVPGVNISGTRLTPSDFLKNLLEVTTLKVDENDFPRLVEVWSNLLIIPDHRLLIPVYIIENAEPHTRRLLFESLLEKGFPFTSIIINILAKRCKFAYFAYVSYQNKNDFENEFWLVPVLMRALKKYMDCCVNKLPYIIQFALLFHSNQTQGLLKRLCKKLKIPYSRRTLSSDSIKKLVRKLQEALQNFNQTVQPIPRPLSPEIVPLPHGEEPMDEPREQKPLVDPIRKWATEAMRWAIGCKNLQAAHTSLLILNTIKGYVIDKQSTHDLLRGICKSTAYFLSTCECKDAQTYEYINETFKLFKMHFSGNEKFTLDYINSFLSFVVSVDAYFDKMIPLFRMCVDSEETREEALTNVIPVLRPSFNELESNSKARRKFDEFTRDFEKFGTSSKEWLQDLQFVKSALQRSGERNENHDINLINEVSNEQLNRAFLHFSLMVETASSDLKKRIFTLSSLMLSRIFEERRDALDQEQVVSEYKSSHFSMEPTSFRDIGRMDTVMQSMKPPEEEDKPDSTEITEVDKSDLNKQALVVIFKEAVKSLPGMTQALDFIHVLSRIDPLIATVPNINEMDWKEAANDVISSLERYGIQENSTVTLTDCVNLGSTSNLLNKESEPKILPYNTQHDLVQTIVGPAETTRPVGKWVERLVKTFTGLGHELHRKMSDRISPHISTANGHRNWEPIPLPDMLVTDDELRRQKESREIDMDKIMGSSEEFLKLLVE